MTADYGFQPIGELLPGVLKDIAICAELRLRLEAEQGRPVTDEEFLAVAQKAGVRL